MSILPFVFPLPVIDHQTVIQVMYDGSVIDQEKTTGVLSNAMSYIYDSIPFGGTFSFQQVFSADGKVKIGTQKFTGLHYGDVVIGVKLKNGIRQYILNNGASIVGPNHGHSKYVLKELPGVPPDLTTYKPTALKIITGRGDDSVDIPASWYRPLDITYKGGNDIFRTVDYQYTHIHFDSMIVLADVKLQHLSLHKAVLNIAGAGTLTLEGNMSGIVMDMDSGGKIEISKTGITKIPPLEPKRATVELTWGDDLYTVRNDLGIGQEVYGFAGKNTLSGSSYADVLHGGGDASTIDGRGGDDTIDGGNGDNLVIVGQNPGNDTINLAQGLRYGHDTVDMTSETNFIGHTTIVGGQGNTASARILLPSVGPEHELHISETEISFKGFSGSITYANVNDVIIGSGNWIINIDSQSALNITGGNGANVYNGSNGADRIYGGTGDDTIFGLGGNDLLSGGKGDDIIHGGAGNTTYLFSNGDGRDIITDIGGSDEIHFDKTVHANDARYERNGKNLTIHYGGKNNGITILQFFDSTNLEGKINKIVFSDGVTVDRNYILQHVQPAEPDTDDL